MAHGAHLVSMAWSLISTNYLLGEGSLRRGAPLEELARMVAQAIKNKPGRHRMAEAGEGGRKIMPRIEG